MLRKQKRWNDVGLVHLIGPYMQGLLQCLFCISFSLSARSRNLQSTKSIPLPQLQSVLPSNLTLLGKCGRDWVGIHLMQWNWRVDVSQIERCGRSMRNGNLQRSLVSNPTNEANSLSEATNEAV